MGSCSQTNGSTWLVRLQDPRALVLCINATLIAVYCICHAVLVELQLLLSSRNLYVSPFELPIKVKHSFFFLQIITEIKPVIYQEIKKTFDNVGKLSPKDQKKLVSGITNFFISNQITMTENIFRKLELQFPGEIAVRFFINISLFII